MKKFVFTLHKLYDVKQSEENQKRVELKGLDKVMTGLQTQRVDMQQTYDGQQAVYCRKCKTGMSMTEVKMFGEYFQYLSVEMSRKDREIADCNIKIEECRKQLARMMNEQKVLERMREEQLEEYKAKIQKDNDKLIEDFMQAKAETLAI